MYTFNKGEVKKLNDFNQEAKNIFSEYSIWIADNMCLAFGHSVNPGYGLHYIEADATGKYSIIPAITNNQTLNVDSKKLFKTISDNKATNIVSAEYNNKKLTLFGSGFKECISTSVTYNPIPVIDDKDTIVKSLRLSTEDVEALCANEMITINEGKKYMTRITRGIIPGLKKSHQISVSIFDNGEDSIYNLVIENKRNELTSFHVYKCIHM